MNNQEKMDMDPKSDACRLCLDPYAECFTTIDNPQLKKQIEKVFCFPIEPKKRYSSGVCQSCSYAISEFYNYSEKVRQNQEVLNRNVANCDPTVDSKVKLESVKVETLSDVGPPDGTEDTCELKDEVSGEEEEAPTWDSNITVESVRFKRLQTIEDAGKSNDNVLVSNSDDDESYELNDLDTFEPKKNAKQYNMKTQQELNEENELFNKHFRMICDLCGTSVATFTELRSHFWKNHKRHSGYVVCCNKKLSKREDMRDHIDFHANPDVFRCEECGIKYKNKISLNKHMLSKHSTDGASNWRMVCDTCGKGFVTKLGFERHINEHMGIELERFQCEICQSWLKGKTGLRNHMKNLHTDGKLELQCDICPKKFKYSQLLHLHKKNTHGEPKQPKHECEFCDKKYKTAFSLKAHRTTHTGEVLYSCKYCGKPNNYNLKRHIKLMHPTEWAQMKLKETQKSGPS